MDKRQLRTLIRQLVREVLEERGQQDQDDLDEQQDDLTQWVANDDENPHKDVHAEPTGRNWDVGLD